MFYSHEVLTSRKYGVATVWLVATLGASTKLKRINKKAIREVDVPKACQTIIDPGAPMALRLQGNLLYGVSRVFLEQCGYVLSDAQNAHTAMRMMLKVVKNAALDPDAGRARPEQLILQDDPSFLPEFALPPPELLSEFNFLAPLDTRPAGDSQSLTPFNSQVPNDPKSPAGPSARLVIPSSTSGPVGDFQIGGDDGLGSFGGLGDDNFNLQLDEAFTFNDDGDVVDLDVTRPPVATPPPRQGVTMASDAAASARVRAEHEEGQQGGVEAHGDNMDVDIPFLGDDLPQGEASPLTSDKPQSDNTQAYQADESELSADAPMRRKKTRKPKMIPRDVTNELRNTDLANWSANYLQNMAEASRTKNAHKVPLQAKKNAEFWVWGSGVGGIGRRAGGASLPTPWDIFCGDNLYELYTGKDRRAAAAKKHDRDSGIDEQMAEEARRVRPRLDEDEEQLGRGQDDEGMILLGDEEVEFPRDEPVALDDQQIFSAMPWNISASNRGSSAVPRSTGLQGSMQQRRSRMVSESPLKNRGQPGDMDALRHLSGDVSLDISGVGLPDPFSSDGIYLEQEQIVEEGSPVRVPTRVHEALSAEGGNFIEYIADGINEKRQRIRDGLEPMSDVLQAEAAADMDEILFEELLPPKKNTKMIACQGLLMVLTLGTAGMLNVRQNGAFAEIGLSLTEKAKATEVDEAVEQVAEGYEDDGEEEVGAEEEDAAGAAEPMEEDLPEQQQFPEEEEDAAGADEPMEADHPEPEQLPEASDDEHTLPEQATENRHMQMDIPGPDEEDDLTESESDEDVGDDGSEYEE